MKSHIKALIGCAAVLAVAGGGYAALMLTDGDSDTVSTAESSVTDTAYTPVELTAFEAADVTSISVENANGTFEAVPTGEAAEDGTVSFTIKGLEDLEINTTMTSSLLNNAKALSSESTVEENAADLEKYGLGSPSAAVTVTAGSERKTILIGNESPVAGSTYCMVEGDNTVYTAPTASVSVFLSEGTYFLDTTLLEAPAENEYPIIKKLTVSREDIDYDIVVEYDETTDEEDTTSGTVATHYMTSPLFAYLDVEKVQDTTHGMFGLSASYVMTAHPTEEEISAAGLDVPFCTVEMVCDDGNTHTLRIGNKLETETEVYYLVMFNEDDVIYAISPDSLGWATLVPDDIMSRMVFGTYVWDIGKLEIKSDEVSAKFEGTGTSAEDYKVTKNGKSCDTERFRTLYTFLLKTSAEEFAINEEPKGEPLATIYLETQDGETKQTVEFYQADGKKALISVNGVSSFKCRTAFVELLIENLKKFDGSEEFVTNW